MTTTGETLVQRARDLADQALGGRRERAVLVLLQEGDAEGMAFMGGGSSHESQAEARKRMIETMRHIIRKLEGNSSDHQGASPCPLGACQGREGRRHRRQGE